MDFVRQGLTNSEIDTADLREQLSTAISALIWDSFRSRDLDVVRLLQRVCASYTVVVNDEITNAQWGQWLFDDITPVVHYRNRFLAQGQDTLERQLSLIAVTQGKLLRASPKFESVMAGVQSAAKAYQDENPHDA